MFFNKEIGSNRALLLNNLERTSAIALCEDDELRSKVYSLLDTILSDAKSRQELCGIPEAALPLSLEYQSSNDPAKKECILSCLKKILDVFAPVNSKH